MDASKNREVRSFLMARDPSIDRRFRPPPKTQTRLFHDLEEEDSRDGSESYDGDYSEEATDDSGKTAGSNNSEYEARAMVYLRLRPVKEPSKTYTISPEGNVLITGPSLESMSSSNNKCTQEKHYSFSAIFDGNVKQSEVYDICVGQKIESEEQFTVLTYGTSGSGKTFTLLGTDDNPGIIPRALENIFTLHHGNLFPTPALKLVGGEIRILQDSEAMKETIFRQKIFAAIGNDNQEAGHSRMQDVVRAEHSFEKRPARDLSVFIWVSFVEIYNEFVYDLLTLPPVATSSMAPPSARKNLKIVCNDGQVFIKGLNIVNVKTSHEALKLLRYGLQHANYASTGVNANSSRSHCIFFVDVLKYNGYGVSTKCTYKFCDLAGSERLDKTGNIGSRLKEAQRINTSLMVLGRCLDAANNARKTSKDIIPFRESKLTLLLQSALLGKEKLSMIVNVTPTDKYYEENLNVLNFASIAKNIIYKKPKVQNNHSRYSLIITNGADSFAINEYQALMEENASLRSEIQRMQSYHHLELVEKEQDVRNELCDKFQKTIEETTKRHEDRLEIEVNRLKRKHEFEIEELKRKHELEIEELQDEIEELKEELKGLSSKETEKRRKTIDV